MTTKVEMGATTTTTSTTIKGATTMTTVDQTPPVPHLLSKPLVVAAALVEVDVGAEEAAVVLAVVQAEAVDVLAPNNSLGSLISRSRRPNRRRTHPDTR